MTREKLVYRDGKLVPFSKPKKKELHGVVQDTLPEPIESMATPNREMFDSLSAYKRHLAEHGKEITGGDHLTGYGVNDYRYKSDRRQIINTLLESRRLNKWGMGPLTEKEKRRCIQEMKAIHRLRLERRFRVRKFFQQKQLNQQQTEA